MISKPTIIDENAVFDKNNAQVFSFLTNDVLTSIVEVSYMVFLNNTTQEPIWTTVKTTTDLAIGENKISFTIPADTINIDQAAMPELTLEERDGNNKYFILAISVKNTDGEVSNTSRPVDFWCFQTPTIQLLNISQGDIVEGVSKRFDARYDQSDTGGSAHQSREFMSKYRFVILEDSISGDIIFDTGEVRAEDTLTPKLFSHIFNSLEMNEDGSMKKYCVALFATTIHWNENLLLPIQELLQSHRLLYKNVDFFVKYQILPPPGIMRVENISSKGYIDFKSEVVNIKGKYFGTGEPVFINNKEIDLTQQGSSVIWEEGFSLIDMFTMSCWLRDFPTFTDLIFIQDTNAEVRISTIEENDEIFFVLKVFVNTQNTYTIFSNKITKPTTQQVFLWVQNNNNLFNIVAEVI